MKVYFEAYGCTLNMGESSRMAELVGEEGYGLAHDPLKSDAIVLSTCTVIKATERKMMKRLAELSSFKKPILVSGCMAEIQKEMIHSAAPEARLLPIEDIDAIPQVLSSMGLRRSCKPQQSNLPANGIDCAVPIAQGCLGNCSYCITRLARGTLRSREMSDVMRHVSRALEKGYKEIRLCAQDTAAYGRDKGPLLPELLQSVCQLPGDYRIRVGMMNPNGLHTIKDDLIEGYRQEKIFSFLHIPVQSGSDRILQLMNRPYSAGSFEDLVNDFRREIPDVSISTDIIVGFPGEGEDDFSESYDLVERIEPDLINITRFSARKGTEAYDMEGKVRGCTVKHRSRRLTELRSQVSKRRNERLVDSEQRILLTERVKPGTTVGRTDNYRPVVLKEELPLGEFVHAHVTKAEDAYLWGELQ